MTACLSVANRWMPTGHDPTPAGIHQVLVVELESGDCGPSTGGAPDDQRAVLAPVKVLAPGLSTGVENRYLLTALRVGAMRLCPLVAVTQGTRQPEVVFCGRATGSPGDDVFHVHRHRRICLWSQTVAAPVTGLSGNFLSQGLGNVGTCHPDYLGASCMGTR